MKVRILPEAHAIKKVGAKMNYLIAYTTRSINGRKRVNHQCKYFEHYSELVEYCISLFNRPNVLSLTVRTEIDVLHFPISKVGAEYVL